MLRIAAIFLAAVCACLASTPGKAQTVSANNVPPPKKTNPGIFGLQLSRDGQTIVTGNFNGTVKIWDVKTGRVSRTLDGHTDVVYKGVLSPNEKLVASCSRDGKIKIWGASSGRELRTLAGHTRPVKAVAFSPNGKLLASSSNDGTVRVWKVATGEQVHSFVHTKSPDVDSSVYSVLFLSPGTIAAANGDGTISYWEIATSKETKSLKGHTGAVFCLALSRDGQSLVSGGYDHLVKLWEVKSGNEIRTYAEMKRPGVDEQVRAIALSPNGKWLVSSDVGATSNGGQIQYVYRRLNIWNVQTGQLKLILDQPGLEINGLAIGPDNLTLAAAGADGIITFWNIRSGDRKRSFSQPKGN